MRSNKKMIFLGLVVVMLGLLINSTLGYQEDYPMTYEESVMYME